MCELFFFFYLLGVFLRIHEGLARRSERVEHERFLNLTHDQRMELVDEYWDQLLPKSTKLTK